MKRKTTSKPLPASDRDALLATLEKRFTKHMARHQGLTWAKVQARLEAHPEKLTALHEMERTGGEPDVVRFDAKSGEIVFADCSPETPSERRNVCYDAEALESRKEFKPGDNAVDLAAAIGIELLSEDEYHELQKLGEFDLKTSSWLRTPAEIRKRGGAIFGDRRYGRVFIYHNGAQSYYRVRGFRGSLKV